RDKGSTLGVHDPDEIGEQGVLVAIAAAELERHEQGVRSGYRRLDAPGRQRARELELLHDAEPFRRADPVEDLERRVRVPERLAEPASGRQGPDAGKAIVEADDEPDAHHLARAHHVDAGAFLVEERHLGRVFHQLAHVDRPEAPGLHRLAREPHPPGQPMTPHDRRRQQHHPAPFSRLAARPRYASITRGSRSTALGGPAAIRWPKCSTVTVSARSPTSSMSCSTHSMVMPSSYLILSRNRARFSFSSRFMPVDGSSSRRSFGSIASARPIATIFWTPNGRPATSSFRQRSSSRNSTISSTRRRCAVSSRREGPQKTPPASTPARMCRCRPSRMLSSTVMTRKSSTNWNVRAM